VGGRRIKWTLNSILYSVLSCGDLTQIAVMDIIAVTHKVRVLRFEVGRKEIGKLRVHI
jgi:hypothetical protein